MAAVVGARPIPAVAGEGKGVASSSSSMEITQLDDIEESSTYVNVRATVTNVWALVDVSTTKGDTKRRNLNITDGSDTVQLTFWGKRAEREWSAGDQVTIHNAAVRAFRGKISLNCNSATQIERTTNL